MSAPIVPLFFSADLYGNILGELPVVSGTFKSSLCAPGNFSCTVPPGEIGANVYVLTNPGINALYIDYADELVFGGIIWGRSYDDSSKMMTLTGNEFYSYMAKRLIRTNFILNNTDQMTAALNLLLITQTGGSPAPPLVTLSIGPPSGVLITDNHPVTELKNVGELFQTYATAEPGFEYRQTLAYTGGIPGVQTVLEVAYPHCGLGLAGGLARWVFDLPGNIVTYNETEDASKLMSAVFGIGQGVGATQLVGGATAPQGHYPLTEGTASFKDVKNVAELNALAAAMAASGNVPQPVFKISVRPEADPLYGTYKPGDVCRLMIRDERFPTVAGVGLDTAARITDVELHWDTGQDPVVMVYTGGAVF